MSRFILVDIDFINLSFQFNKQTRRKDKNLIFSFFFTNQPNYCYYWLIYIYKFEKFFEKFQKSKICIFSFDQFQNTFENFENFKIS